MTATVSPFETVMTRVQVEQIMDLRHRILREGLPVETANFPGDNDSTTWHFAAFHMDRACNPVGNAICCASFMLNFLDEVPAWQLRGMATDTMYQGGGVGKLLLVWAEQTLAERSEKLFWCNARMPAVEFYEKQGWRCISDVFDIPTAGPHRKMMKQL